MEYVDVINSDNKTVQSYSVNDFGDKEIIYNELDEDINFNIFEALVSRFKLELRINKELFSNGYISKELYSKIENILLDRISPFAKHIEM